MPVPDGCELRIVKRRVVSSDSLPEYTYQVQTRDPTKTRYWNERSENRHYTMEGALNILKSMRAPDEQVYP